MFGNSGHRIVLRNAVVDQSAIGKMILPAEADQIGVVALHGFYTERPGVRV